MSDEIIKVLKDLARSAEARPVSARLRDYIEEIDAAIKAGVRPDSIEKALADFGIELSPNALRGALYRFRKKRKTQGGCLTPTTLFSNDITGNSRLFHPAPESCSEIRATPVIEPKPSAYKSDLTLEEKERLKTLSPVEKIEFFRQRENHMKFTHNPTPERFRHQGE